MKDTEIDLAVELAQALLNLEKVLLKMGEDKKVIDIAIKHFNNALTSAATLEALRKI